MSHTITFLAELDTFACTLLQSGRKGFLLSGELGVGKTQFVKALVA